MRAETRASCAPASCMPSPESPHSRTVAASSVATGVTAISWRGTLLTGGTLRALALGRHGARVGGLAVDRGGEMLRQVMNDPLDGQDSDQALPLVKHRQVAISAFFHSLDGGA